MALICSGIFKGFNINEAYLKIAVISFHHSEKYVNACFRVYSNENTATNYPEDYIDSFIIMFPLIKDNEDVYTEAYERLKNGNFLIDPTKYREDGSIAYTNNAYFPNIISMRDA